MQSLRIIRVDDKRLRKVLSKRLAALGAHTPAQVIAICADRNRPLIQRSEAASLIGGMGGLGKLRRLRHKAADVLISAFKEGETDLAWHSAMSLGQLNDKRAVKVLLKASSSSKDNVIRLAAVCALRLLGDSRAVNVLSAIVSNPKASPQLRGEAAEALAFCGRGSTRAVRSLVQSLQAQSAEVRFFCAYALGFIGTSDAIPPLQRLLKDKEKVRGFGSVAKEAAKSLRELGGWPR